MKKSIKKNDQVFDEKKAEKELKKSFKKANESLKEFGEVSNRFAEDKMLADFVMWAWNTYPDLRGSWWHTPNETVRLKGESVANFRRRLAVMKAKGVLPGVSDLVGLPCGPIQRPWAAEFKLGADSPVQESQLKFGALMRAGGGHFFVVRSGEEAKRIFTHLATGGEFETHTDGSYVFKNYACADVGFLPRLNEFVVKYTKDGRRIDMPI